VGSDTDSFCDLSERIEQVARSTVDPPLHIRMDQFPGDADASIGNVVVEVPASSRASHMVDGIDLGRDDKPRHRLSDAEVMRRHAVRRDGEEEIIQLLDAEIARRDPFGRKANVVMPSFPRRPPRSPSPQPHPPRTTHLRCDNERPTPDDQPHPDQRRGQHPDNHSHRRDDRTHTTGHRAAHPDRLAHHAGRHPHHGFPLTSQTSVSRVRCGGQTLNSARRRSINRMIIGVKISYMARSIFQQDRVGRDRSHEGGMRVIVKERTTDDGENPIHEPKFGHSVEFLAAGCWRMEVQDLPTSGPAEPTDVGSAPVGQLNHPRAASHPSATTPVTAPDSFVA
jgi:hypothetical protein